MMASVQATVNSDTKPATRPKVQPFKSLDAWRGLASIAVVGYHWHQIALRRYPELEGNWFYSINHYGQLGVQLFFVISGYCIAAAAIAAHRRGDRLSDYAFARVRRIFPPYWAGLALTAIMVLGSKFLADRGLVKSNFFSELDLLHQSFLYHFSNISLTMPLFQQPMLLVVSWTLAYEIAFYAIVGFGLWVALRRNRSEVLLPVLHCITLVTLLLLIVQPQKGYWVRFPFDLWPQFGLGVVLYDLINRPRTSPDYKQVRWWAGAIIGLTALFIVLREIPLGTMGGGSREQYSVALVFMVYLLLTHRFDEVWSGNKIIQFLAWLGLFSYSLYLTHVVTIRLVSVGVMLLRLPQSAHGLIYVAAVVIAVALSYVFFLIFEKPLLSSRRRATTPAAPAPVPVAQTPVVTEGKVTL